MQNIILIFVHFANRQNKDCMIQYSYWKTYRANGGNTYDTGQSVLHE